MEFDELLGYLRAVVDCGEDTGPLRIFVVPEVIEETYLASWCGEHPDGSSGSGYEGQCY